jgi:hypothetical protein
MNRHLSKAPHGWLMPKLRISPGRGHRHTPMPEITLRHAPSPDPMINDRP